MTLTARDEIEINVVTPTIRKASRKYLYWAIAVAILLILAFFSFLVSGSGQLGGPALSPTDASPTGSKAIAEVLKKQGVSVTSATSMQMTRDAVSDPSATTIFVIDDNGFLDANALRELTELSSNLVTMSPTFDQLDTLVPEIALAGKVEGSLDADCAFGPAKRAESVLGDGTGFRLIEPGADSTMCFASGDDVYSLIQVKHVDKSVTVIGTRNAFSNEFVQQRGNAAFALGLLGEQPHLVWLIPSIDEAAGESVGDLTPVWVSSVMALLVLSVIAAAFWRGRRFGPLVVESLPVVVRASETMHGRALLYQKASDYLHTLDGLRMGTIDRLGVLCGLPTVASIDDVIRAVASVTRRQTPEISNLLRDAKPINETQLIALSDELLKLETATAIATRPSSATMDSTATTRKPEGTN